MLEWRFIQYNFDDEFMNNIKFFKMQFKYNNKQK